MRAPCLLQTFAVADGATVGAGGLVSAARESATVAQACAARAVVARHDALCRLEAGDVARRARPTLELAGLARGARDGVADARAARLRAGEGAGGVRAG